MEIIRRITEKYRKENRPPQLSNVGRGKYINGNAAYHCLLRRQVPQQAG